MLLIVVAAILWLVHRATRLLKVPAPALIHVMGIDIPEPPKVSVSGLTARSVSLHWKPVEKGSVVRHIIEVDGRRVGETDRADSSVTLTGLVPNRLYRVKIVAVNPSNYRSHATAVWVHTKKADGELPPANALPGVIGGAVSASITNNASSASTTAATTTINASSPSGTSSPLGNGGDSLRHRSASSLKKGSESKRSGSGKNRSGDRAYTVQSLTQEVESVQGEINDVLAQAAHAETEFTGQEAALVAELEEVRNRKRAEDQQRAQLRSETKALEDARRALEAQKTKAERRHAQTLEVLARHGARRSQLEKEINEYRAKAAEFESSHDNINFDSEQDLDRARAKVSEGQQQLGLLEDEIKELAGALHRAEDAKGYTKEFVERLREHTDSTTGLVKDGVLDEAITSEGIPQDVAEILKTEIGTDKKLEDNWKDVQKGLEARYVRVYKEYREAEEVYNAAIKERQQQQQQSVPSAGATAVLDSVNAAVAQSSLRKNRSFQGAHSKDTSPPSVISPLQTSFFPDQDGTEAIEDPDALLSPSVDMLLPKNLFGTDDLTESFATLLNDHGKSQKQDEPNIKAASRASGSILASAFGAPSNSSPTGSVHERQASRRPSILSLGDDPVRATASPMAPASPQSSFHSFLAQPNTAGVYTSSIHSLVDHQPKTGDANSEAAKQSASVSKKFSDIFFFGRPKREPSSLFFPSDEVVSPIGRPRTGSFSSAGSGVGSAVQPPSQSDFFSPWKDDAGNGLVGPHSVNHSNAGSTLSLDKTAGATSLLSSGWSVFDGNQSVSSQQWSQGMPALLVTDSAGSSVGEPTAAPSTPSKKSGRGFAGLFSSEKESPKPSKERSIASLFGKSDDSASSDGGLSLSADSRESGFAKDTFLQKSTRMFTGGYRRSASNSSGSGAVGSAPLAPKEKGSGGSGKFVRRLSLFGGKKGEKMEELEDVPEGTEAIAEDPAGESSANES